MEQRVKRKQSEKLISKLILGVALGAMLFPLSFQAVAQQMGKVPRVGFLSGSGAPSNPPTSEKAFRQGLRDLGYVDGKNILFEFRYAEGKRDLIPSLVAELVQLKVDVLVTGNLTAIRAAKRATETIPIVMVTNADPVATKLIDSLARPGGNITGLTPMKFEFVINLKTAKALNLTIPQSVLYRADKVIR